MTPAEHPAEHPAEEPGAELSGEDVERLTEAVLDAVEERTRQGADSSGVPVAIATAMQFLQGATLDVVRRYHRLEIQGDLRAPSAPVLFVANHGFGGIFDLNVIALAATFADLDLDRPVTFLTHQVAWTLGVGKLIETLGAEPASRAVALAAFERGEHVAVLPGGDLDAFKSFGDRNTVVFGGRDGFAKLAVEAGVPIVPVVTAGAGETLLVLSDGQRLARALRLDKTLRLKALPVTVSLPWGLNVGGVGLLPYLPLPGKLLTRVLSPMTPADDEAVDQFAARVQAAMQEALTDLAASRRPWSR